MKLGRFLSQSTFTRCLVLLAVSFVASPADAAALFNFSGGDGAPLALSIPEPITYTITNADGGVPIFVIDGAANGGFVEPVLSTISYSINGGAPILLSAVGAGTAASDITADDVILGAFGDTTSVAAGDTVTLSAGLLLSSNPVNIPPPASGWQETFIASNLGVRLSPNAVPEPASLSLLALGSLAMIRRKR